VRHGCPCWECDCSARTPHFRHPSKESHILCVTGDELDAYANWGLILNACLTLFGITASASLTCCLR